MKKMLLVLVGLVFATSVAFAQEADPIKDFTQLEVGAMFTTPHNTPLGQEQKMSVVPSFMLKQVLIQKLFTLGALETNLGTGPNDTTAFKFGFGYELPGIDIFSYKDKPVTLTLDLILAKDIVTEWDNNAVVGAGLKLDRNKTNNFAFMTRVFWNHVEVVDPQGLKNWDNTYSVVLSMELGLQ
jgi:hypothetical protein